MDGRDTRRRLFFHGILLFFLGLLSGVVVQSVRNPRMGLSAHTGGVTAGTFLALLGAVWTEVRLQNPAEALAYWLAVYGSYASWIGLQLAAVFGTSRMTPIAGAGYSAAGWQEAIVNLGLMTGAAALLVACVLLLGGLRGRAAG